MISCQTKFSIVLWKELKLIWTIGKMSHSQLKPIKLMKKRAEEDLYIAMCQRGYDDEFIENFFKKDPMEYTLDDEYFDMVRWTAEEIAIIDNGGIYYEDLEEDYNEEDDEEE